MLNIIILKGGEKNMCEVRIIKKKKQSSTRTAKLGKLTSGQKKIAENFHPKHQPEKNPGRVVTHTSEATSVLTCND